MWIDSQNFNILESFKEGQVTLDHFTDGDADQNTPQDFKVAFNDLTADQKKSLVEIPVDFKLYVSGGRVHPKLKSKVIKEPLFKKDDIIGLIKSIYKEKDRQKVMNMVVNSSIPPVVINQWLMQGCIGDAEAWKSVVEAEGYTDNKWVYAAVIGDVSLMGGRFGFPRKLRGN